MDPLWQQINEAIHRKDTETVEKLVTEYLKAQRSSPSALYEASEFFRKNADYANALRVLPKERSSAIRTQNPEIETKLELQQARVLNILGASHYALRVIERIRSEGRAKSKIETAEIYHCSNRFREVLELIGTDFPLPESEPWHQDWLLHFYYAYALNALKKSDLAIKRVDGIYRLTASPLIKAMALTHKGQFFLQRGDLKAALSFLSKARDFFKENDRSFDHASLQKWLGICFLKMNQFEEAESALKMAFEIFYQPSFKPEDWMEIRLWLDQIPGDRDSSHRFAPRIAALGGPEYSPLTDAGIVEGKSEDLIFSLTKIESVRETTHIDRSSDTAWLGKKARLGLDLVDELIWSLIYAGEYGLPQFKLYELLWPDEPFAFDQHQKRLDQLIGRARTQGYKIVWKELHLFLKSEDVTTTGRPTKVIRGLSFLKENSSFVRRDIERWFSVSQTTAISLCRYWLEAGLAISVSKTQYRSLIS